MKLDYQRGWWGYLAVLVSIVGCCGICAEAPKIAMVDMQKLFREHHRTQDEQKFFAAELMRIEKEVVVRAQSIHKLKQELIELRAEFKRGREQSLEASQLKIDLLSQQLKMMESQAKNFEAKEKLRVEELKLASMEKVMKEIKKEVTAYAKDEGFDYVFDRSGKNTNQVSFVMYLRDTRDITAPLLKKLNRFTNNDEDGR